MKKCRLMVSLAVIIASMAAVAHADLDSFLRNVNVEARADMNNFNVKLSAQFGVPLAPGGYHRQERRGPR